MTDQDMNRPSDTEAAHAPEPGAAEGSASADQISVDGIDGAKRREHTGDPDIHGRSGEPTAGAAVADRLPRDAVAESGEDVAVRSEPGS